MVVAHAPLHHCAGGLQACAALGGPCAVLAFWLVLLQAGFPGSLGRVAHLLCCRAGLVPAHPADGALDTGPSNWGQPGLCTAQAQGGVPRAAYSPQDAGACVLAQRLAVVCPAAGPDQSQQHSVAASTPHTMQPALTAAPACWACQKLQEAAGSCRAGRASVGDNGRAGRLDADEVQREGPLACRQAASQLVGSHLHSSQINSPLSAHWGRSVDPGLQAGSSVLQACPAVQSEAALVSGAGDTCAPSKVSR